MCLGLNQKFGDYSSSVFTHNSFDGSQPLKGYPGASYTETETHFDLLAAKAIIGAVDPINLNTFRKAGIGIRLLKTSELDIDNCLFDQPGMIAASIGYRNSGIYAEEPNGVRCGLNEKVTFQNSGYPGIYVTRQGSLEVKNSEFTIEI